MRGIEMRNLFEDICKLRWLSTPTTISCLRQVRLCWLSPIRLIRVYFPYYSNFCKSKIAKTNCEEEVGFPDLFSFEAKEKAGLLIPTSFLSVLFLELLSAASVPQFHCLTVFSLPYNVQISPESPPFSDGNPLWPGTAGVPFPPVSDDRQFRKLLLSIHCSEKAYVIPPRFWL